LKKSKYEIFEQNLTKLLSSTKAADPGFDTGSKERLRQQLVSVCREGVETRHYTLRWVVLTASSIAIILFLGMVIYPLFWAGEGLKVKIAVSQGSPQVIQNKPVFFNMFVRAITTTLKEGDNIALPVGSSIVVGSDEALELTFDESNTITLHDNSKMTIKNLVFDSNNLASAIFDLEYGVASNNFNRIMVDFVTPVALASIKGTVFKIEVVSPTHTFLASYEGTVQLTMGQDSILVSAGEQIDAIEGQPLVIQHESPPKIIIMTPGKPEVSTEIITLSGETDTGATLTVNGKYVDVDINGFFTIDLNLEIGANNVSLVATSPSGKSTTINIVLIRQ
jgi:hypothetical protein